MMMKINGTDLSPLSSILTNILEFDNDMIFICNDGSEVSMITIDSMYQLESLVGLIPYTKQVMLGYKNKETGLITILNNAEDIIKFIQTRNDTIH